MLLLTDNSERTLPGMDNYWWSTHHVNGRHFCFAFCDKFSDVVYADDTALVVNSTSEAISMDSFKHTAATLGLRVSWPNTKLQNLGAGTQLPAIVVDGNTVDSVDSFVYLRSVLTSDGYCRPDINRRIGRASSVMSSPHHIWKNRHLSLTTKTRIYQVLVQSVLLHASETWTLLSVDSTALEAFHMKCQRQLQQIKWHQFIRNVEISATSGLPSISETISGRRNGLFGHVARRRSSPQGTQQSNQPIARSTTKQPVVPSSRSSS